MRRFLLAAAISLFVICPWQTTQAQEPPPPAAPAADTEAPAAPAAAPKVTSTLDTNGDGVVDAAETAAATNEEGTIGGTVGDGAEAVSTITEAWKNRDKLPTGMLWAIILGAVFKLLLSVMKVVGKNVAWFKSKDGKRVLKYSTIGLGAVAGLLANLAFGLHWLDAAQIMLSGPLAVAIHEYTKDSKDPDANGDDKPAEATG